MARQKGNHQHKGQGDDGTESYLLLQLTAHLFYDGVWPFSMMHILRELLQGRGRDEGHALPARRPESRENTLDHFAHDR